MTDFTRRSLLKSGIAASAGLIASSGAFIATSPQEALADIASSPTLPSVLSDEDSPREKLLLDFGWRFHLGNAADAMQDFRYGAPTREGTFSKSGQDWLHNPKDGSLDHSFDDSSWRVVNVPHDWAIELPWVSTAGPDAFVHANHGGKPLGREFPDTSIGWYQRTFEIPASDTGRRISIDFDGVFRDATVLFNGFYLGRNLSGYAPFTFDVTDYVVYGGKNVITVRVDATFNEGWYYEGAGIYRHTWLTKTDPLHVARFGTYVRSEVKGKGAAVTVGTELINQTGKKVVGRVTSQIFDPSGVLVATTKGARFEIDVHGTQTVESHVHLDRAEIWSLDDCNIYQVVSHVETGGKIVDQDQTTFGIRTIRFDPDHGFFLNNQPLKIKGTCNHHDHSGVGIGVPDRIFTERVAALKAMGSNGWRTAHNPVAPEFLDACDKLGMMVMSETRLFASTPEGLSQLERMVKRDRNHPSIIIWSLANEEYFYQGSDTGARIISTMKDLVRQLDPTRPVTAAMNGGWGHGVSNVVDVQGFNYWNGNLPFTPGGPGGPHDIDAFHATFPKTPCIGSETANGNGTRGIYKNDPVRGWVNSYGTDDPARARASEEWWKVYDSRDFLSGGFTWVGIDYRGEPGPYDLVSISSQSGCLDTCLFPKDVYYYYKAWWGSEPLLHLFPHWNWAGQEGQNVEVQVYSNVDSVELFVNGKTLGSQNVVKNSHLRWSVPYAAGVIEARGTKNGSVVLTDRRETTGDANKIVLRPSQSFIAADGEDLTQIAVEVQDAQGRIVPTAMDNISFTLVGPGKIIGVGNGDPSCRESDCPTSPTTANRSAFNGCCLVIVQSSKLAGGITLSAVADGLVTGLVTVVSKEVEMRPTVA